MNFSIVKDTAVGFLGEAGMVEFRAEFFNLFNHTNFAVPASNGVSAFSGTCSGAANPLLACPNGAGSNPSTSAGLITSTVGTSRQIQFALKILF